MQLSAASKGSAARAQARAVSNLVMWPVYVGAGIAGIAGSHAPSQHGRQGMQSPPSSSSFTDSFVKVDYPSYPVLAPSAAPSGAPSATYSHSHSQAGVPSYDYHYPAPNQPPAYHQPQHAQPQHQHQHQHQPLEQPHAQSFQQQQSNFGSQGAYPVAQPMQARPFLSAGLLVGLLWARLALVKHCSLDVHPGNPVHLQGT